MYNDIWIALGWELTKYEYIPALKCVASSFWQESFLRKYFTDLFHSPLSCLIIVWLGQFLYLSHTSAHFAVLYTCDYSVRPMISKRAKPDLVSLNVKLAGEAVDQLRLSPGKQGQPVLIPYCSFQHELLCQRHLGLSAGLLMLVKRSLPPKTFF